VSEGEAGHLGWVMAHPARARRRVRAAPSHVSLKVANRRDSSGITGLTFAEITCRGLLAKERAE